MQYSKCTPTGSTVGFYTKYYVENCWLVNYTTHCILDNANIHKNGCTIVKHMLCLH